MFLIRQNYRLTHWSEQMESGYKLILLLKLLLRIILFLEHRSEDITKIQALVRRVNNFVENLVNEIGLPPSKLELVEINNQIAQLTHNLAKDIPVKLDKEEKVEYNSRVKSHNKKVEDLKTHRGKV